MTRIISTLYAAAIYGFIFLPVAVLVLFSFQGTLFPIPQFSGHRCAGIMRCWAMHGLRLVNRLVASLPRRCDDPGLFLGLGFCAVSSARIRPAAQPDHVAAHGELSHHRHGSTDLFQLAGLPKSLMATGIGHVDQPAAVLRHHLSQMGEHQANIERAARDLGAKEWQVLTLVTAPMLWPALFASFFLSMTFSWDEFVIAFLLTRFDTTLPVEIWNLLRAGLNPKTNAVGSLVFGVSIVLAIVFELVAFRKRPQ
jgi:spermidine/putrescine transport system permease protein